MTDSPMNDIQIALEPRSIATCPNSKMPAVLRQAFEHGVLQHQDALYLAAETHDVVLDLAATGTGKTKAGLSVLNYNKNKSAVYIAPTNALVEQQTQAACEFVVAAGLPHIVKAASAKHVKSWPDERVGKRSGEKLYDALREPATVFPECGGGRPLLLVTNPDIFYYATFFSYQRLDRSNIASAFYRSFATVIFDEFHLYSAKQLVSLLFYLAVSQVFGYFAQGRKVVLLTATPEPACERALEVLKEAGCRVKSIDGTSQDNKVKTPSQTAVDLTIRPCQDKESLIATITEDVIRRVNEQPDRYGAVILDAKDTLGRVADKLRERGYADKFGRITGDTHTAQRHQAAQNQVVLATSTVDVGFNFERDVPTERQNLDWLIFSSRDRFSFWQRVGRVGRVLGKAVTTKVSEVIAFLPEQAWEEGISDLNTTGGRIALREKLAEIDCLKRPFLEIYWRSEAFLEMAKPLVELEDALKGLPQSELIQTLYGVLQSLFGGRRPWSYYRYRIKEIREAEGFARKQPHEIQKEWKYLKGENKCLKKYVALCYAEDYEADEKGTLRAVEQQIKTEVAAAAGLKDFAEVLYTSYAPIFKFRDSLFKNVTVQDPHLLLLDEAGETIVDPIHLLRFFEFVSEGDRIIALSRAEPSYNLEFHLTVESLEDFKNNYLCRLMAFRDCTVKRAVGDVIRPTALIADIGAQMISGVVVKEGASNRWAIIKLRKLGLESYPIQVSASDSSKPAEFTFFPSLNGILAIAQAGVRLKAPDNEDFWVV